MCIVIIVFASAVILFFIRVSFLVDLSLSFHPFYLHIIVDM